MLTGDQIDHLGKNMLGYRLFEALHVPKTAVNGGIAIASAEQEWDAVLAKSLGQRKDGRAAQVYVEDNEVDQRGGFVEHPSALQRRGWANDMRTGMTQTAHKVIGNEIVVLHQKNATILQGLAHHGSPGNRTYEKEPHYNALPIGNILARCA